MNIKQKLLQSKKLNEFLVLNLGSLLSAVGIYFFKFPNNFSTGGVSGLAVVLSPFFPNISAASLMFIMNMGLLILGFLFLGKSFGVKTAYTSIAISALTWIFEKVYPMNSPFTTEPLLELIIAMTLPALGAAILFNMDASTGGTDVIAMIMKKYTSMNIGVSLFFSDLVISISSFFIFDITVGLFSILGLFIKSLAVDSVIENINTCKFFTIVTDQEDAICSFIVDELHRGATISHAQGAFTHTQKHIIITALRRPQAVKLNRFIKSVDPHAFILITNTSEIIGKGFRGF